MQMKCFIWTILGILKLIAFIMPFVLWGGCLAVMWGSLIIGWLRGKGDERDALILCALVPFTLGTAVGFMMIYEVLSGSDKS